MHLSAHIARLTCFHQAISARLRSQRGAVMAEYGLLLALIGIGLVVALVQLGPAFGSLFDDAGTNLNNATPSPSP